jgi:hypothetical protein
VVDIDPMLFSVAESVIRGRSMTLTESYAEVNELAHISKEWLLTSPAGALDPERFHFLLADALMPLFLPGTFDTVVTPWFIDAIPDDLRDLISGIHRILKSGGRWINVGPLRYSHHVPVPRWFTREEIFELAQRAGFQMGRWATASVPYSVSKHTGRGNVEWVLTFAATKLERATSLDIGAPPDWLLFGHLPIPTFAAQQLLWPTSTLMQAIVSAIDGQRTLDDLTRLTAARVKDPNVSLTQIRHAIRQCLVEMHPACRDDDASGNR